LEVQFFKNAIECLSKYALIGQAT